MKLKNKVSRSIGIIFLPIGILLMLMLVSTESFSQCILDRSDSYARAPKDRAWGWGSARAPQKYTDKRLTNYSWDDNVWSEWSGWTSVTCFRGIEFKVRRSKEKSELFGKSRGEELYRWDVAIRNRFSCPIDFFISMAECRPVSPDDGDYDSSCNGSGYGDKESLSSQRSEDGDSFYRRGRYYDTDKDKIYVLIKNIRYGSRNSDPYEFYERDEYSPCDE